jgi:L-asparaginase
MESFNSNDSGSILSLICEFRKGLKMISFKLRLKSVFFVTIIFICGFNLNAHALPKVAIIATGGTIAMKKDVASGGVVPKVSGEGLVSSIPELKELAEFEVKEYRGGKIASENMTPTDWINVAKLVQSYIDNPKIAGVVVTHGTDTIEETAFFLDLTLDLDKAVVLVGSQRNASEPTYDGAMNLINAVRQVLMKDAKDLGVTVTMNQYIHGARDVRKTHTNNMQTFDSGPRGALGYIDHDRITVFRKPLHRQKFKLPDPKKLLYVPLLTMFTGADGRLVNTVVKDGASGIVIEGFGIGNVNEPMSDAIKETVKKGIPVVIGSRVYFGRSYPVYATKGGGVDLKKGGTIFSGDLTPWKARIALILALTEKVKPENLQAIFDN